MSLDIWEAISFMMNIFLAIDRNFELDKFLNKIINSLYQLSKIVYLPLAKKLTDLNPFPPEK